MTAARRLSLDGTATKPMTQLTIPDGLGCVTCGYLLKCLPSDGQCPECGTPIARSLRGDLLELSNSAWLRKLGIGAMMLAFGASWVIAFAVGFAGINMAINGVVGAPARPHPPIAEWVFAIGTFVPAGTWLAGVLLVTTIEPRWRSWPGFRVLRNVTRGGAILTVVGIVMVIVSRFADATWAPILSRIGALLCWGWPAAHFGVFVHLRLLAQRIPNASLVRATRRAMWGVIVALAALPVIGGAAMKRSPSPAAWRIIAVVPLLLVGMWCVGIFIRYCRAFGQSARLAAANACLGAGNGPSLESSQ